MEKDNFILSEEQTSAIVDKIVSVFSDGKEITHECLKSLVGLREPSISDYSLTREYIEAYQQYQFAYMSIVEKLRTILLKEYKMYLKNNRGNGYMILRPNEQVRFGYDRLQDKISSALKEANEIMTYVQPVSFEQQAKDNDLRSKAALLKQILKGVK